MGHYFVIAILPEGHVHDLREDEKRIEEFITEKMAGYDAGNISGNYHEDGFHDSYSVGGRFDGAVNGLLRVVRIGEHLEKYERVQTDEAVKRFTEETELARNSRLIREIRFPPSENSFFPNGILFPDGKYEGQYTRRDWWQNWQEIWHEIVDKYGNCMAVGLDCHL